MLKTVWWRSIFFDKHQQLKDSTVFVAKVSSNIWLVREDFIKWMFDINYVPLILSPLSNWSWNNFIRSRNCLPFANTWVHPRFLMEVHVAHFLSSFFKVFLCCSIMCLYVLSFVLWCPLRFPHKYDVQFVSSSCCL
jgi:hypothetical protein